MGVDDVEAAGVDVVDKVNDVTSEDVGNRG